MKIAGIDYSLTSPSIVVHEGLEWSYSNCRFYYYVNKEKFLKSNDKQYTPTLYPEYINDAHRYDNLSSWSMGLLETCDRIFIEGYAFGAVGRVFGIAENGGVLKHKIWKAALPLQLFAPSEIKRFATGKGTANKQMMCDAFVEETGVDVRAQTGIMNPKVWNPVSDIVDAYYICKLGFSTVSK